MWETTTFINMASGWTPVTRKTVGKKKFMKKGFVPHNHDFSDFFQVDGAVIPPSPGLYRVKEKKEREPRGSKYFGRPKKGVRNNIPGRNLYHDKTKFYEILREFENPSLKPRKQEP